MGTCTSLQRRNAFLLSSALTAFLSSLCPLVAQAPQVSGGTIYKEFASSVVSIEGKNEKGVVAWTGTGFVVGADGVILTNYHVIRNSKEATTRLANGDAYDTVEVSDVDRRKDIALLKIKAVDLHPVRLGSSDAVQVGDTVYSLSNPLGVFDNTLSEGIVSGVRQMDGYRLLQITAPISHGSSGGPLFNTKGEVIGITSQSAEAGQNINFAVPIDYARGMLATPSAPRPLASVYDPEPQSVAKSAPPTRAGESAPNRIDSGKNAGLSPFQRGLDAYQKGDYVGAANEWRPLAAEGDPIAQFNFGLLYFDGRGVPQSVAEAASWFQRSAEQGYTQAQHNLGAMYGSGQGVKRDYVQAYKWLNICAAKGNSGCLSQRDLIARRLNANQIAEAQRLAADFRPKTETNRQ
jgi:hypothetical protein